MFNLKKTQVVEQPAWSVLNAKILRFNIQIPLAWTIKPNSVAKDETNPIMAGSVGWKSVWPKYKSGCEVKGFLETRLRMTLVVDIL